MAFYIDYAPWKAKGRGVLFAFRQDKEAVHSFHYEWRKMLLRIQCIFSKNKTMKDVSKGSEKEGEELIRVLSGYREVHTDRAHVAIGAAMLGKETIVYSNSYHKVKGIYEYSLSHLPGVKWAGNSSRGKP